MISPPIVAPQTAPRRGPRQASAAQQNFLANRAGAQPVTPTPPSGKPNQFSASGPGSQPSPSSGAGSSASGVSSIPAASSGGASSSPASLGQVPSGSGMMKRGGRVQNFAAGGATETNQYGSWGGANAADAATGTPNSYSNVAPQPSGISNTQGPFSTTPSPYSATFNPGGGSTPSTPTGQLSNGAGGFVAGNVGGVMTGQGEGVDYNNGSAINPQVNNQSNYKGPDYGQTPSPLGGGLQLNVSNPTSPRNLVSSEQAAPFLRQRKSHIEINGKPRTMLEIMLTSLTMAVMYLILAVQYRQIQPIPAKCKTPAKVRAAKQAI